MKSVVIATTELDDGLILTPARYISRGLGSPSSDSAVPLNRCAQVVKSTVSPKAAGVDSKYLVIDTGDAEEGFLNPPLLFKEKIGSIKKVLMPGDVVISRLRPYLRQVAYVDPVLFEYGVPVLCSTEFYILRPLDEQSIAYLVPWLLSDGIQKILSESQEGGHHPRFSEATLSRLLIPEVLYKTRADTSAVVEEANVLFRHAKNLIASRITEAGNAIEDIRSIDS